MFKSITVAVDGSDHAKKAVEVACEIARKFESKIHLVHSPELNTATLAVGAGAYAIEPSDSDIQAAGKIVMDRAMEQVRDSGCEIGKTIIGNGDPAQEVLNAASSAGADLIITGRRGLGGLASLFLGSTSLKISNGAECACLTVK